MKTTLGLRWRQALARRSGSSLVEFTVLLPVLMLLVFATIDLGRAIQINNILVNMSREGANLAARTSASPAYIINALVSTAASIDMVADGKLFLTRLVGRQVDPTCLKDCEIAVHVKEQSRSIGGAAGIASQVYSCSHWSGGTCSLPSQEPVVAWGMPLRDGEEVRVLEAGYAYVPVSGLGMIGQRTLYSQTAL
jgi:hypothetical protein